MSRPAALSGGPDAAPSRRSLARPGFRRPSRLTLVTLHHGPGSERSRPCGRLRCQESPASLPCTRPAERAAVVVGNRVVEVGLREDFRRQLFQGTLDGVVLVPGRPPPPDRLARRGPVAPARTRRPHPRAPRGEPRARPRGRLPARGRLVLRRLARNPLRALDHLLERRAVDPVDQRLVDRADRALADRVVAPLVRRHLVVLAGLVLVEDWPGSWLSARFSEARSRDWHFRRRPGGV